MKLFLVLLLAAPLVLAKPSHKSILQGSDTEYKDDDSDDSKVNIKDESYIYEILSRVDSKNGESSIDTDAPDYENSVESDNNTYSILVSDGRIRIKDVEWAGDDEVESNEDGDTLLRTNFTISEAELTYKYNVNGSDGELIEEGTLGYHIDGAEASVTIRIQRHNHKYKAKLGDVETIALGTIGDIQMNHKVLDDAVATTVISLLKSYFTQDVDKYIAEKLKASLHSAVSETDINDYIDK
uniref:Uncharacterized protein n=1 Tax=Timema shepardi TaxID=629360 RepID=A0A7R9FZY7_TIMSH|nr:unnamed protein product [Timema shepardi]